MRLVSVDTAAVLCVAPNTAWTAVLPVNATHTLQHRTNKSLRERETERGRVRERETEGGREREGVRDKKTGGREGGKERVAREERGRD